MAVYERDGAQIYYEVTGEGFPLLLLAPGAMHSTIAFWDRAAFNPVDAFASDFQLIAMDQRNAGNSHGPLDADDPWGMFADDQLGLLDHLGIDRFFALGCCIGCSHILHLVLKARERLVAGVMEQPIGIDLDGSNEARWRGPVWQSWADTLAERRDDLTEEDVYTFCRAMWGGEFVFNVDKEFIATVDAPMLVMPGKDIAHPRSVGIELARLMPGAELVENWAEPEQVPVTIERIRSFFKSHEPA